VATSVILYEAFNQQRALALTQASEVQRMRAGG
jgi:hypothetical protein